MKMKFMHKLHKKQISKFCPVFYTFCPIFIQRCKLHPETLPEMQLVSCEFCEILHTSYSIEHL